MEKCKRCGSENVKKISAVNLNHELLDNVIERYKCSDCGREMERVVHIG